MRASMSNRLSSQSSIIVCVSYWRAQAERIGQTQVALVNWLHLYRDRRLTNKPAQARRLRDRILVRRRCLCAATKDERSLCRRRQNESVSSLCAYVVPGLIVRWRRSTPFTSLCAALQRSCMMAFCCRKRLPAIACASLCPTHCLTSGASCSSSCTPRCAPARSR